jgi:hypothetical protein
MESYFGIKTFTSTPRAARCFGRAPTTSARPPVLANGVHSDATMATFMGFLRNVVTISKIRRQIAKSEGWKVGQKADQFRVTIHANRM